MELVEEITSSHDHNNDINVFVDLLKASDMVDHYVLAKLHFINVAWIINELGAVSKLGNKFVYTQIATKCTCCHYGCL